MEYWTSGRIEGAWVKNGHPFAFEINNRIKELKTKVDELIKRHYNQGKPVTFYTIEEAVKELVGITGN